MLARAKTGRGLTPREAEVLMLVSLGLTDREIGVQLRICTKTASTHVAHILDKLDASGRAHAVGLGYRRGLITWQDDKPSSTALGTVSRSARRMSSLPPSSTG